MSIKPTTRAGYRESARPHSWRQRLEHEPLGSSGSRSVIAGTYPNTIKSSMRFAGERSSMALTPYSLGAPQGVGYRGQPEDSKFQTFSDNPQAHPEDWGPMSGYF
jgi:hypothetical protein